jgi:hypothetical protein
MGSESTESPNTAGSGDRTELSSLPDTGLSANIMEKGRKGSYQKTEGGSPTFWQCSPAVLEAISERTFNPLRNNIVARRKDLKYSIYLNMGGDGHDPEELQVDQVQVHHSRGSELSGEIGELDDDIQNGETREI